jgi:hypothetical protein
MRNPKECQGQSYHTPSMANPLLCNRCNAPIQGPMPTSIDYKPDTNKENIRLGEI